MNATKSSLSALAASIGAPQSQIMKNAQAAAAPAALQDAKGTPLSKTELRKIAEKATAKGVTIAKNGAVTPAPDAGKAPTDVTNISMSEMRGDDLRTDDKTGMPAFLKRGTPENAKLLSPANTKAAQAKIDAKTKADAEARAAAADKITKAKLHAQVSAAKPVKAKTMKTTSPRKESKDAVKPIVPQGGAAVSWWNDLETKALKGHLPSVPDFSADTHKPYRDELKAVVALAKAGDIAGLKKDQTRPTWNSRTQIVRYRELCLIALHAKSGKTYKVPGDHRDGAKQDAPKAAKPVKAKTSARRATKTSKKGVAKARKA